MVQSYVARNANTAVMAPSGFVQQAPNRGRVHAGRARVTLVSTDHFVRDNVALFVTIETC